MNEIFFIISILLGINKDVPVTPEVISYHTCNSTAKVVEYITNKSQEGEHLFKTYRIRCNKDKCVTIVDPKYTTLYMP